MITITEQNYDSELRFEEQSESVKQEVIALMSKHIPAEEFEYAGITPRVIKQEWDFDSYKIIKNYLYANPPESDKNGIICEEKIIVKEV